ncbi:MAG: lysophospholipid acyltransferase family protein [Brevinema sp.]
MSVTLHIWSWGFFVPIGQRVVIKNKENIPMDRPCIVVSNHSSMIDIPMLGAVLCQPYAWVLKESILRIPVVGWLLQLGLGIPIPRSYARISQDRIIDRISKIKNRINPSILIFPEGTRSKSGEIKEFKRGFIKILKEYQIDVLPISLIGCHDFMPVGTIVPHPQKQLMAVVNKPISWQELTEMDEKDAAELVRSIILAGSLPEKGL